MLRFVTLALVACVAAGATQAATPAVSAADQHSLALHRDGSIRGWGDDSAGALGTGRSLGVLAPVVVNGLPNVVEVAAGQSHTVARTSDGRVFAWGANAAAQLGDGTTTARSTPVQVVGLTDVVQVGAGISYSIARKSDGTLWVWGANNAGVLGNPTADFYFVPGQVPLAGVAQFSAGPEHVLAITSDGRAWAWGRNDYGQLGDGNPTAQFEGRAAPLPVSGLTAITAVAAGQYHSLARRQDGTVVAWGYNEEASLGDGTTVSRSTPVAVQALGPVAAIAAGSYSAAIKNDGTVWAWGANGYGQIDDTFKDLLAPVRIPIDNVAAISVGFIHAYALKTDATVWAWGTNAHGELGDGTTERRFVPVPVGNLTGIVRVSAGGRHGAGVRNDGRLFVWGADSSGQLGIGTRVFRTSPVIPAGATGFTAISAGSQYSVALHQDGRVFAAGENEGNQLGDGTFTSRATFAPVPGLSGVTNIAAGGYHTLARRSDGTVWAFGGTYKGRLGVGRGVYPKGPVQVLNLTNVVKVAAGNDHSLAVKGDGTVWAWGENRRGQLGDGTTDDRYEPVQVPGLANVIDVAAGYDHSLALKSDGSVWAWGGNDYGQLGDDTEAERRSPVRVLGLVNATAIAAGTQGSGALTSEGGVWTWGINYDGQLGDGTNFNRSVPFRLSNVPGVRQISVGGSHTLAMRADGTVFAWGRSDFGQVGDATLASRTTPVLVVRENGAGSLAGNDWFLDLDPGVPKNVDRAPVFLVTTTASGADVNAQIQFRSQDVGTSGSVYVFALAPASMVHGAVAAKDKRFGALEKGEKDSVQCVLAQLNASGQLQAVSTTSLQAYVTGVLTGQGQAVQVLNGVPTATIGGATFYVGYGSNPTSMIGNGTNRSVVSVPAANQCQPQAPQTGWWWNTAEGGRGYSIEVAGNHLFFASYLYDVSGRATWLIASGNTSLDGSLFSGRLESYSGGQTLSGSYRTPAGVVGQDITLAFSDASRGTMIWPGGTVAIERFNIVPNGLDEPARDGQPESGWWWNPAESGRGFFLEWQGGQLFMAGYMYDDAGNPIWYLSGNSTPSSNLQSYSNTWLQFGNGQTLTGPYRAPVQVNGNVAPVTIQFSGAETGIMTLPGGRTTAIRRFRF